MFCLLFDPFIYHGFMRRALVACLSLSLSSTPIGVFLLLRRMTLIGDALSHAILPGVAVAYFFFGASIIMMGIGGFLSGLLVVILSGWVSSKTLLQEDASFAGIYLASLASGVMMVSLRGFSVDILDLLFGSIFIISIYDVYFIAVISSVTFISLALFYRALIIEIFDSHFLNGFSFRYTQLIQTFFLFLVVLNLVASFRVIGTLMSVGLMTLPALSAYYWASNLFKLLLISVCIALVSSLLGLLCAFYFSLPAGSTIILCNSMMFLFSIVCGKKKGNGC